MYGLFELTFDYYCWEELVAVSAVKENLEKHYAEIDSGNFTKCRLYGEKQSRIIVSGDSEECHYVITPVLEV